MPPKPNHTNRIPIPSHHIFHYKYLSFAVSETVHGETIAHYWDSPYTQPYFDNTTRRDLTATVGQPALLHCRVRNLGDRAVSYP